MKYKSVIALVIVSTFGMFTSAYADIVPNKLYTPGNADTTLTKEVLCDPKFRTGPLRNVSEKTKNLVYYRYKVQNHQGYCSGAEGCEVDHLISLQLGGSNSPSNLWPQPFDGEWNAHDKDKLENKLKVMLCSGKISLDDLQKQISSDWITAYKTHIGPKK